MTDKRISLEYDGGLTPESRTLIIAEVLRFMGTKMEPVPYGTLLGSVISSLNSTEELVSAQVMHAVHELILAGMLSSNGFYNDTNETAFMVEKDTAVSPSRKLTGYAFRELAE